MAVSGFQSHGGTIFNPLPSLALRPLGDSSRPKLIPIHSACSPPTTMFLVLVATEELKEFFAKARAGSVRLIKVIIEDGECPPLAGAWLGG